MQEEEKNDMNLDDEVEEVYADPDPEKVQTESPIPRDGQEGA